MYRVLCPALLLVACTPSEQPLLIDAVENQPAIAVDRQPPLSLETVREAARDEANRRFRNNCGTVTIPDGAFVPVEVTGGGYPEYAVFFGRARCDATGLNTDFASAGDGLVQIWSASSNVPELLFNHAMRGFTPRKSGLVSFQHGAFCDGGVGAQTCVVTYGWRGPADGLEVQSRRLFGPGGQGSPPPMRYGWNYPEGPEQ